MSSDGALSTSLPRAPGRTLARLQMLADMARIRRVEFLIAEIPIVAIPLLLTAGSAAELAAAPLGKGIALFFLLFNFGDMVNCLADRELDAQYKTHLSRSIYRLGVRSVQLQIALTTLLAVALAALLSVELRRPLVLVLVVLGLVQGAAYSVEPVRLKRRGALQLLCLWLIIFVGPMMLMATLLRPWPPLHVVLVAGAYGALQMGIILVNTAEDFPEDRRAGVRTTIVALGLARGIDLAGAIVVAGGAGLLAALGVLHLARGVSPAAWLGLLLPATAVAVATRGLLGLRARIAGMDVDAAASEVKRAARWVPAWVTLVAWSTLASALVMFLSSSGAVR